jgi:hypothetical protein
MAFRIPPKRLAFTPKEDDANLREVTSLSNYIEIISSLEKNDRTLFRGQSNNFPLLPKLARLHPSNFEEVEAEILDDFKYRASSVIPNRNELDYFEWLALMQHYGIPTRLLDWTTNPLVSLYFAVEYPFREIDDIDDDSGVVWVLHAGRDDIIDRKLEPDVSKMSRTKMIRATNCDDRISNQQGWFSVFKYLGGEKAFVTMEKNKNYKDKMTKLIIKPEAFGEIRKELRIMGINPGYIYPGLDGICRSISNKYFPLSDERCRPLTRPRGDEE